MIYCNHKCPKILVSESNKDCLSHSCCLSMASQGKRLLVLLWSHTDSGPTEHDCHLEHCYLQWQKERSWGRARVLALQLNRLLTTSIHSPWSPPNHREPSRMLPRGVQSQRNWSVPEEQGQGPQSPV